jgi:hypothetical protein
MNNTNDFFPSDDYKVPETSNYMKLKTEGAHKFRTLSSAIVGYEYFNDKNIPVRSKTPFEETPGIKKDGKVSHFWAFLVYNYEAERVQVLEIAQKSIQQQMKAYIDNPDWGNPKEYDITINRKGTTKNDTEYTVMPSPHRPLDAKIKEKLDGTKVDLELLYVGADPFSPEK